MVIEVGDKVVVWNPGTPFAFAKKAETIHVGDTVDVITLSDGTKLPLPRLTLNLDDFVWVLPEWPTPIKFEFGFFDWGALGLGAAVFTIDEVIDCDTVSDPLRSWDANEVSNCWLIPVTGAKKGVRYNIVGFDDGESALGGHVGLSKVG